MDRLWILIGKGMNAGILIVIDLQPHLADRNVPVFVAWANFLQ